MEKDLRHHLTKGFMIPSVWMRRKEVRWETGYAVSVAYVGGSAPSPYRLGRGNCRGTGD